MTFFTCFYLDSEKDIVVDLYKDLDRMWYRLSTPNHHTGNLIRNLAKLCQLPLSQGDDGLLVINGEVPCYIDADNKEVYIFRLKGTKVANIYPDGRVEMKASIPAISKRPTITGWTWEKPFSRPISGGKISSVPTCTPT